MRIRYCGRERSTFGQADFDLAGQAGRDPAAHSGQLQQTRLTGTWFGIHIIRVSNNMVIAKPKAAKRAAQAILAARPRTQGHPVPTWILDQAARQSR